MDFRLCTSPFRSQSKAPKGILPKVFIPRELLIPISNPSQKYPTINNFLCSGRCEMHGVNSGDVGQPHLHRAGSPLHRDLSTPTHPRHPIRRLLRPIPRL